MNNFWQRALTGAIFIGVVIAMTLFNEYSFLCLLSVIAGVSLFEYYRIVFRAKMNTIHVLFVLGGTAVVWMKFYMGDWIIYWISMVFALTAIAVLLSRDRSWKQLGYYIGGLLYISLPLFLFQNGVIEEDSGNQYFYKPYLALNLFVLIWASDTFAYLCGRAIGKRKLFASVSPNKTWEGFIGGLLLTTLSSLVLAYYFDIPYHINIGVALCTVVFGSLGDLVESMLKREFQVKDSGIILPGHGGMLDRFDALLISLPFTTAVYHLLL